MTLVILAFFSGILTVLAPCVLPLLPIILAGSSENISERKNPYIIIVSLILSVVLFSILLKGTTLFIDIPSSFWKIFSGWILVWLWIITIFPNLWQRLAHILKIENSSNTFLANSTQKSGIMKPIFIWMALGPVFSSCSPTYALILAIILPANFFAGVGYLFIYALWLGVILLAIALFGQKIISKLKIVANPNGNFKKVLWVIFLLVWLAIITGFDKTIETTLLENGIGNFTEFEANILENFGVHE